jgi:hypothetical protein
MPSIELNPQIAYSIVDRVHSFYTDSDIEGDKSIDPARYADSYDSGSPSDPASLELETGIDELQPSQQAAIVALMWLGRGDFDASQWTKAYALAKDRWNPRTADYLTSTPLLADYLEEALNQLGYTRE